MAVHPRCSPRWCASGRQRSAVTTGSSLATHLAPSAPMQFSDGRAWQIFLAMSWDAIGLRKRGFYKRADDVAGNIHQALPDRSKVSSTSPALTPISPWASSRTPA